MGDPNGQGKSNLVDRFKKITRWFIAFGAYLLALLLLGAALLLLRAAAAKVPQLWLSTLNKIDTLSIEQWLDRYVDLTGNLCDLIAFLFITPEIGRLLELPFSPRRLLLVYFIACFIFSFLFLGISDLVKDFEAIGIIGLIFLVRIRKNKSLAVPHALSVSLAVFAFLAARTIGVLNGLFKAGLVSG